MFRRSKRLKKLMKKETRYIFLKLHPYNKNLTLLIEIYLRQKTISLSTKSKMSENFMSCDMKLIIYEGMLIFVSNK